MSAYDISIKKNVTKIRSQGSKAWREMLIICRKLYLPKRTASLLCNSSNDYGRTTIAAIVWHRCGH